METPEQERIRELEAQLAEVRWMVEMFTNRLNAYEVGRIVTVDGPDDPRARLGSMMYRGSFTNGEMGDAKAVLSTNAGKLGAAVIKAAVDWRETRKKYFSRAGYSQQAEAAFDAAMTALEEAVDALEGDANG